MEHLHLGENFEKVRQLAAGDQQQFAPGFLDAAKRIHRRGINHPVMRDRAVVVRRQRFESHLTPSNTRFAAPSAPDLFLKRAVFTASGRAISGGRYCARPCRISERTNSGISSARPPPSTSVSVFMKLTTFESAMPAMRSRARSK